MRQTLFYVPHELFGIPVFGLGWAVGVWTLIGMITLIVLTRRNGWTAEVRSFIPLFLVVGVAFVVLLPMLEVRLASGTPLGIAIRGYGVFVLAGIIAGVWLSIWRARQIGLDPELIYSFALSLFIISILTARLFYIIQYWPEFHHDTLMKTLGAMLKFTEGGLVVYGAVIGGMSAMFLFARRHDLSVLELGDLIAPGMAIGLALGRIGCLMNGCCYGGTCESWPLAVTFPQHASKQLKTFSPPYAHQLVTGELSGFRFASDAAGRPVVGRVKAGSAAADAGLTEGTPIQMINDDIVDNLTKAQQALGKSENGITVVTPDAAEFSWNLPSRSLPVHPTQIYSAVNAAFMCLVVWFWYPYRTRPGQVLVLLFTLYSVTRFLLEWVRHDEVGQLGTAFTISQLVSMMVFVVCIAMWLYLLKQPPLEGSGNLTRESAKGI